MLKNTGPATLLLILSVFTVTQVFGQENASNPLATEDNRGQ